MSLYYPIKHRPLLPESTYRDDEDASMNHMLYAECAWYAYWKWVFSVARRYRWDIQKAREWVHRRGKVPNITDEEFPGWDTDDAICAFMMQFPTWQRKGYDRIAMIEESNRTDSLWQALGKDWVEVGKLRENQQCAWTLSRFMSILPWTRLCVLVSHLEVCNRREDLKFLGDDPIFGAEARFELGMAEMRDGWDADEVLRRSALPQQFQYIDLVLSKSEQSSYALMYPHDRMQNTFEGRKQVHDIDNCLTVLADGGCIFRLQVLDTTNFNLFRLEELRPPWWSLGGGIGETDPDSAEYDFPFPDFGINEGDDFDLAKFEEVVEAGIARINTRGERKFGVKRRHDD